jgi:sugar lactone lactonase YvrE
VLRLAAAGVPDGMTIDAAGKLWVVLGESGCVVQVRARQPIRKSASHVHRALSLVRAP